MQLYDIYVLLFMITYMPFYRCNVELWEWDSGEEGSIHECFMQGRLHKVWNEIRRLINHYVEHPPNELFMRTIVFMSDDEVWSDKETEDSGGECVANAFNDEKLVLNNIVSNIFPNVKFKNLDISEKMAFKQLVNEVHDAENQKLIVWSNED